MAHEHDHNDPNHTCGCGHDEDHQDEIEVVELEDENGEKEEFAILEEVDFEGRHFAIMAPLAEVQAYSEAGDEAEGEANLTIEIFEVKGDDFTILEDEAFAQRLLTHLDDLSAKLEEEGK
ncbi:hypothetical protein [Mesoterricola sediminis]|uniref:DUF1292 domain-containing protein n=1 Tax=Mesoterricola sediminis TaxID=2927980 RepID=A0AA48GTF0_9BACT|nr:hypothetical protein [Mesoterricola sediminis]BDU77394.1 hypothetical protein METESE_23520 [Mesoterricola sediminis]